jgi:6-phosphogluconate dehydrogenase
VELGLIGLGRMGANMARRLRKSGIEVVAFNRSAFVEVAAADEN